MLLHARRYDSGEWVAVEIAGQKIASLRPASPPVADDRWIAPGLLDLQVNGYGGREFVAEDLTVGDVEAIAAAMARLGTSQFCPTLTTAPSGIFCRSLATIHAACEGSPQLARRIPGIHLEGPYISPKDGYRGAHPLAYCRPPDWDEFRRFQEAANGRIRLMTISPEYDSAATFIAKVVASGAAVAIGHTAATRDQILAAIDAGATLGTHLGNGCPALLPRHANCIWPQLADDRLAVSLIADGHHLPSDVLRSLLRAKGVSRCVLVSDLAGLAGLPPGEYASSLCKTEILEDGKLVVAGQREFLAGASKPLSACLPIAKAAAGLSIYETIAMANENPAKVLGIEPARLEPGEPADLLLFDDSFTARECYVDGKKL